MSFLVAGIDESLAPRSQISNFDLIKGSAEVVEFLTENEATLSNSD
ncbi:MAG: hypothetical protein K9H58_15585 [Bacteroidales bacterium]|nr:hypothetical protein [Bacteroidales bacterium]